MLIQQYELTGTLWHFDSSSLLTCNHLPDKYMYQLLNEWLDYVHSFLLRNTIQIMKAMHVKQELVCEMCNHSIENRLEARSFQNMYYSGPCILRPPVQPEKNIGLKLEVVLKWKDIYI